MKEKKIGISKVVIQMGDKEATLTVEQAKELQAALNALLGEKVVEKVVEHDRWYPYNPYVYPPYWTVTVGDQPNIYGKVITYGSTTGTYSDTSNSFTINLGGGDPLPV